jgi:hypothetical protein
MSEQDGMAFEGRRFHMVNSQRQWIRNHSRIGWLALFLVLIASISFVKVSTDSFAPDRLTETTIHSRISLAQAENRIALVKPIFTATAYSGAFYIFYSRYSAVPPGEYVTTDLDLLNRTVVNEWEWSSQLGAWFESETAHSLHLVLGETVTLLNEIDVDQGALFHDGERLYDVVVLGFTEYVTEREYLYYKQFVASGGTLIIMDACSFLAEVTYSNGYLSLTKGHSWEFNGTHAWKSAHHRWYEDNINWVGSNLWRYWTGNHYSGIIVNTTNALSDYIKSTLGENIYVSYRGHEENFLQNNTETDIIGYWNFVNSSERPEYPVAAYMHRYGEGTVIHSGIMASDVLQTDGFLSVFLATSIRFGLTGEVKQWTYPEPLLSPDDFVESTVKIYNKNGEAASGTLSGLVYCDINFNSSMDIIRHGYQCDLKSVTGEITEQVDTSSQVPHNTFIHARNINTTSWRFDINTFLYTNGKYLLTINAIWEGLWSPIVVSETVKALYFDVFNDWWISNLPWIMPIGSIIFAAIFVSGYTRFNKTKP